jgi:Chitobiase/beta-hexosaminidase C-terminal domain
MAVISVTVIASSEQIVSGIPTTVAVSTNIPSTIFYTLDGTQPTLFSTIYTGPIFLPYAQFVVNLNIMATNGTDFSPVVSETYQTDMVDGNVRLPHSATTACPTGLTPDTYPFGTPPFQPQQEFLNPADAGVTVYNPALPATPTGFGSDGYPTGYTNQPWNIQNYQIPYSTTNAEGQMGPGIGTLPARTYIPANEQAGASAGGPAYGPEQTDQFTTTFNPRALVIFQDFSKENPYDPPQINRQYFSLENQERARDGTYYFNSGSDGAPPPSGSFVKAHYNPRTNEMTHYYRDAWSNQWIISTAPFVPNGNFDGNLSYMPQAWGGKVIEWIPFQRRVLF